MFASNMIQVNFDVTRATGKKVAEASVTIFTAINEMKIPVVQIRGFSVFMNDNGSVFVKQPSVNKGTKAKADYKNLWNLNFAPTATLAMIDDSVDPMGKTPWICDYIADKFKGADVNTTEDAGSLA